MKLITLCFEDSEKQISVEEIIRKIDQYSNIDYLAKSIYSRESNAEYGSFQTILLNIDLLINIDDDKLCLNYNVLLRKSGGFNYFTNDEKFPYEISHQKYIFKNFENKQFENIKSKPFIEHLILLIDSQENPEYISEKKFCQINASSTVVSFESYMEFKYDLYMSKHSSTFNNQNLKTFKKIFLQNNNYSHVISIYPQNYKNLLLTEKKESKLLTTNNLSQIIRHENKGEFLVTGFYSAINNIFYDNTELTSIIAKVQKEKRDLELKKNKNYDIRNEINWSNYNDDLDSDQQDSEFWNQF